jgi:large subunit ribosomal protein L19
MKALALRGLSTVGNAEIALEDDDSIAPAIDHPPPIKFKRPDKTARHIMNVSTTITILSKHIK